MLANKIVKTVLILLLVFVSSLSSARAGPETDRDLRRRFAEPPQQYWPRPLWFWNNTAVTAETVKDQMRQARDRCRYGGFGILPFGKEFSPAYLSEGYFRVYGAALDQAKALGFTLSLYDEYGFPSGSAGSQNSSDTSLFAQRWPNLTIKRLDKHEWEVKGPAPFRQTLPPGKLMAVVAMNPVTWQRVDLTETVREGQLDWQAPDGSWKVMAFVCVIDGDPICDYLDPEAADRFIELTHQAYYDRFATHFGTTIDSTFFDEPTLYRAGGRTWTDQFNEKFRARHGFDPRPYYPALWYDIGPATQAARNYLFGFRAELYATGFTKRIQDWCHAHRITATGHQDQEEVVNPVSVSGDLMKCFQSLDVPGIDKIGGNRPAERFYKVISSAAYNWDKSLVMSETYGAMGDLGWDAIYTVAMEQYTKGVNLLIPHAVWYDDRKVTFKPELSWRSPLYAERLPEFNTYLARLNVLLQNDAAHVADIAVLYPIATLQGSHHLDGPLGHYQGGVTVPEADYVDVGELLAVDVGRDYTFLHPEVLEDKCVLDGDQLVLPNDIHPGRFRVLILPGHKTIRWSSLRKIQAFYEQGGNIIATGQLPCKSAEFGHDEDVVRAIAALFGADRGTMIRRNPRGGCAIRLAELSAESLREALDAIGGTYDVAFEPGQALRYIHKRWQSRHLYFLANLDPRLTGTTVTLRGRHDLAAWDPHTGAIQSVQATYGVQAGTEVTRLQLSLPHLKSLFLMSAPGGAVFESEHLAIRIDGTGSLRSLRDRSSDMDYLAPEQPAPLLSVRVAGQFLAPQTMHCEESTKTLTLQYAQGITAVVKSATKATHVTFELLSIEPEEKVDLVVWGPYPTRIKETIGETVGVVRDDRSALGIQTLNVKTLGGFPTAENDVMPGRGDTAQPTEFGSVLQAFTRDRSRDRTISNWGHPHYFVPAYHDGGVIGSKIALFGCPAREALKTLGEIEVAEGLPHPMIDGVWGKVAPGATASYLIVGFGEDTIDEAVALTRRAGLRYLYHGGPFATWGHFQLHSSEFPPGWAGLKDCVEKAKAQGVSLGVHTLSNFITTNDSYVTPVPDDRLAKVGSSVLTEDIDASRTEIPIADPKWFNQMENNTLRAVQIGRELIRYESVSEQAPWRLLGCRRGVYQTQAAAHPKGTPVAKLMDHAYKVFLTDAELSQEVARRLADLFNQTGLRQISFDGLEGNWSTGLGQYGRTLFVTTWYDRLRDDLRGRVITDASNPGHYFWHIYTRMNWGEPWYAGFRESQTEYRLKNQDYFRRNLMPCMLGWFNMTGQTSLEDIEWLLARAAGFDAGFALNTSLRVVRDHGRSDALLRAIHAWETARMSGAFSESQKRRLQDIGQEFHLEALDARSWNLYPIHSAKHTFSQQVQPGQPSETMWELDNPHGEQPLQFILHVSGDAPVGDVTLEIDGAHEISIPATLQAGSVLEYSSGGQGIVYDKNWKELERVALDASALQVGPGQHRVRFGCRFHTADQPEVKLEFRTVGEAQKLSAQSDR